MSERKFIWGIKSHDDMSGRDADYHTMNDIDIAYDEETKKYYLSIETIFQFDNGTEGQAKYIERLFNQMTKWMSENNRDIYFKLDYDDVFTNGINFGEGFDSLEELYASFRILVSGFLNMV